MIGRLDSRRGHVIVTFPYDRAKVEVVKVLAHEYGAVKAWCPERKEWRLPAAAAADAARGFPQAEQTDSFRKLIEAEQRQMVADRLFQKLIDERIGDEEAPLPDGRTLYAHQKEDVRRILQQRFVILANQMGTGKTLTALVAAKAINAAAKTQTLVIAPVGLCQMWRDEGRAAGVPLAAHSWAKVPDEMPDGVRYVLIGEECHMAQSTKAERTKRFLALAKKAVAVFCLTGTPMKNGKPANLFPLLRAIRQTLGAGQLQLGAGDLALRGELGRGNLNLGYDQLGSQVGYNQAQLNQQALLAMMRGY